WARRGLQGDWREIATEATRVFETGDPRHPVVLVTGEGGALWNAEAGRRAPSPWICLSRRAISRRRCSTTVGSISGPPDTACWSASSPRRPCPHPDFCPDADHRPARRHELGGAPALLQDRPP